MNCLSSLWWCTLLGLDSEIHWNVSTDCSQDYHCSVRIKPFVQRNSNRYLVLSAGQTPLQVYCCQQPRLSLYHGGCVLQSSAFFLRAADMPIFSSLVLITSRPSRQQTRCQEPQRHSSWQRWYRHLGGVVQEALCVDKAHRRRVVLLRLPAQLLQRLHIR